MNKKASYFSFKVDNTYVTYYRNYSKYSDAKK